MPDKDPVALAADAYVYGFPLVFGLSQVLRFTHDGLGDMPRAPFNAFAHADHLPGPRDTFASANRDTVHSIAQLDLSACPLLLHVPDTAGAYYVVQFVDAWTNDFAYVGRRATGTAEGDYLITGPGWSGALPHGGTVIAAPTPIVSLVARFACDGPDDLSRVAALQRALTVHPAKESTRPATGLPRPDPGVRDALRFYEQLRVWMAAFPPGACDRVYQQRFAPLGLLDEGPSPYTDPHSRLAESLLAGMREGKERVEAAGHPEQSAAPGGWTTDLHLFDYNLDHIGPGAVDEARWKVPDRHEAYLRRAVAARAGLWGNHAYEAVYAHTFTDVDGKQLTGAIPYTLRFDEPPPVDAFWSMTMYDMPHFYLVDNPIERYSIGDRTPGLVRADDGSITLHLRHDPPDQADLPNWLPTPAGDFRPILRMYQPRAAILDGAYQLPAITPVP